MKLHNLWILPAAITAAICCPAFGASETEAPPLPAKERRVPLQIGQPAPPAKFGTFLKGEPVVSLDPDQCYLIECWATWCGPCVQGFPHLTEIAKATEGKLTVIGVCVKDKKSDAELKSFVEKQGDRMGFRVAVDTHGSIDADWARAAGSFSIPWACLVVKGRIAWMGHPQGLQVDQVLELVDGKVSVDEKAKEDARHRDLQREIDAKVAGELEQGNLKAAVEAARTILREKPAAADVTLTYSRRALRHEVEALEHELTCEERPGEAIRSLAALTDSFEFLTAAGDLVEVKLTPDQVADFDRLIVGWQAKIEKSTHQNYQAQFTRLRAWLMYHQGRKEEASKIIDSYVGFVVGIDRIGGFLAYVQALFDLDIRPESAKLLDAAVDQRMKNVSSDPKEGEFQSSLLSAVRVKALRAQGRDAEAEEIVRMMVQAALGAEPAQFELRANNLLLIGGLPPGVPTALENDAVKRLAAVPPDQSEARAGLQAFRARLLSASGDPAAAAALLRGVIGSFDGVERVILSNALIQMAGKARRAGAQTAGSGS